VREHQRPPKQLHESHTQTHANCTPTPMSSPLLDVWEAAASSPFSPAVGKNTQFTVGFVLLAICMSGALVLSGPLLTTRAALILTTIFGLSTRYLHISLANLYSCAPRPILCQPSRPWCSRFISIWVRGLGNLYKTRPLTPNSFGAVYMICAVGVYV
jgi:hypothetical protein